MTLPTAEQEPLIRAADEAIDAFYLSKLEDLPAAREVVEKAFHAFAGTLTPETRVFAFMSCNPRPNPDVNDFIMGLRGNLFGISSFEAARFAELFHQQVTLQDFLNTLEEATTVVNKLTVACRSYDFTAAVWK